MSKFQPKQHHEVLVLLDGAKPLHAANRVLNEFGIRLKWRSSYKELGDQVYLSAEKVSTEPKEKLDPTKPIPKGPRPKVGDPIYTQTSMSIDHGEDDIQGGLATISKVSVGVSAGEPTWFIEVRELPGIFNRGWNYTILLEDQAKLKKEFGRRRAKPDPDNG